MLLPLLMVVFGSEAAAILLVVIGSLISLALMGAVSASIGGANIGVRALRVTFWGLLARLATALVGSMLGTKQTWRADLLLLACI